MPVPSTINELLDLVRKSGVVDEKRLEAHLQQLRAGGTLPNEPNKLAGILVRDAILTHFQAEQFLLGKWRRFTIGKYKVLEKLGSGGMGSVYLCEHKFMRRRVAVKILPAAKADDPSSLERFYREARAVAALDHPNIVRAYDIDQEDNLHFLVMEYVDGSSLQELVKKHGQMNALRASHYVYQSAHGLQHAHESGLVHRDIKPGNVLVDRSGTVKILDMGLARFFHDEDDILTKKYDENVLGTADYLAPEQALDSHGVDIRADIYSLGATFYFTLTRSPPFSEGTVAQKLIWHQTRQPKAVRTIRPDVPEGLAAIIDKMMAKDPAQRYQTPIEVADALAEWVQTPIPAPPEAEMPRLSPAAMGLGPGELGTLMGKTATRASTPGSRPATPPPSQRPSSGNAPTNSLGNPSATAPGTRSQPTPVSTNVMPAPATKGQPGRRSIDNGAITAPTPAQTAPPDEGAPSWDMLAADGVDPSALTDTGSASGSSATKSRRTRSSTTMLNRLARETPRLWIILGVVGAVLFLLCIVLVVFLATRFLGRGQPTPSSGRTGQRTLIVRSSGPAGSPRGEPDSVFRSLRDALAKAAPGERIVVEDEVLEEPLHLLEGKQGKDLTIEAGAPSGKPVIWRAPVTLRDNPLIILNNTTGLHLKGFVIDCQDRTNEVVKIYGQSAGTSLEDLHLQGFKVCAIQFTNCSGDSSNPVILKRVRTTTARETESALMFGTKNNTLLNQHIRVEDCRFEGPYKSAVDLASSIADVEFTRNRFHNVADGFHYRTAVPRHRIHLTLGNNTFHKVTRAGLHFTAMPLSDNNSRINIKDNLFISTAALVQVDGAGNPQPKTNAHWIWINEGDPLKTAPAGDCYFRKTFAVKEIPAQRVRLDIVCDDSYTVWLNGVELGSGPLSKRVASFDATKHLQAGNNVLAVQGTNKQGPAGLLASLSSPGSTFSPVDSNGSWKAAKSAPTGWQKADFDDKAWAAARDLGPYNKPETSELWKNLTWDSMVQDQFVNGAKPIISTMVGNVRDKTSAEANMNLNARLVDFPWPQALDPGNDGQFLRYPSTSPLASAGSANGPVGVPPLQ